MSETTLNVAGQLSDEQVNLLAQQYTALQQGIYVSNVKLAAMMQESNKIVEVLKAHQEQVKKDAGINDEPDSGE